MGDYADMATEDTLEGYFTLGRMYTRMRTPRKITCRKCGQTGLYWSSGPNYYLEEYDWNPVMKSGKFVPHSCKFKGFGK